MAEGTRVEKSKETEKKKLQSFLYPTQSADKKNALCLCEIYSDRLGVECTWHDLSYVIQLERNVLSAD